MPQNPIHIRHGLGAVRPYLHGPANLPEFIRSVFGAVELERHAFGPEKFHVQLQVSDSVIVIEAGELPEGVEAWKGAIYVYVEDVDAVYAQALKLGAVSVAAPVNKPYEERQCGFLDAGGNMWWVSTYQGAAR